MKPTPSGEAYHDNGICQPGSHGHDTPTASPKLLSSWDYDLAIHRFPAAESRHLNLNG